MGTSRFVFGVTNTSAARTVSIQNPAAAGEGAEVFVKDESGGAGTHNITVQPTSGLIDGASSLAIAADNGSVVLRSNGIQWRVIATNGAGGGGGLTLPVVLDGSASPSLTPLTVVNGKNGSGVAAKVSGTAATGYLLQDASGVQKGVFGYCVANGDWIAGTIAGDVIADAAGNLYIRCGIGKQVSLHSGNDLGKITVDESAGIQLNFNGSGVLTVAGDGITLGGNVPNLICNTGVGTNIATGTTQKIGFWGVTPVVQQVFATGTGKTVDNLITLLQTLGLCKQS